MIFIFAIFCSTALAEPERPNILIILMDDLGWADVGWTNHKMTTTLFLDKMAKNGTILDNSYATNRCSPTRAALLTGRYPFRYGMGSEALDILEPGGLDTDEVLLPQIFREGGYSTHMIGKWHLGFCKPAYRPVNRGFDSSFGSLAGQIDYYTHKIIKGKVSCR